MNYRHAFHAGNFADVCKHVVLIALLEHLKRKDKPFLYLDTHAGAGRYDLSRSASQRSGEYRDGIARLLERRAPFASEEIAAYIDIVRRSAGPDRSPITAYPGSPLIALALRRRDDRIVLIEAQSTTVASLREHVGRQPRVAIVEGDGYRELLAYVPPIERRGLVLIDPPYESDTEFARVLEALRAAHGRWPSGAYAIWYPLTSRAGAEAFRRSLADSGIRRILDIGFSVRPLDSPLGMPGCGIAIVNPPWQLDERLRQVLPELHDALAPGEGGTDVRWLVPE
jgi:23S rRNA (adenine2030-N6)-methyltransferase